ncbi:MAG TPA: hypothetical protein VIY27_13730 [Myxococcota bacterium]
MTGSNATLDRLELRIERLKLTFRFTYAYHAREVRFECDRGEGFVRIFPETFSFRPDRHDPAEVYLQLVDLARKPRLLSPNAKRRDAQVLASRLVIGLARYLEHLLDRVEQEKRLAEQRLTRVYEEVALLAQLVVRFAGERLGEDRSGMQLAVLHLRKIAYRALLRLMERCVAPAYLEAYVAGQVDPVDPSDDLSESGFFHTMESGDADKVNRSVVRLAERAFYRWLEDICLDESNRAFEAEGSPFASREIEVRRAISSNGRLLVQRGRELTPFLRRNGNRDCIALLGKLEAWFLRQYDVHHAAAMIRHADNLARERDDADIVLSRHRTRNYVLMLAALVAPFAACALFYERAPLLFDALCAIQLVMVDLGVLWFLFYRFLYLRDLTIFHASVPRIMAGIVVGYLPIFFIDEVWGLASQSWFTLVSIALILGATTLLYLYIEVQYRLGDTGISFARARQIFLLGVLQSAGIGLLFTGMVGGFMATRSWSAGPEPASMEVLRHSLSPFLGELPRIVGIEPFYAFPAAVFVMTFMSFFIGTFLQLMWEDTPITEPL